MPLTIEEVGRVRAALAAETANMTDEQVASGAADTIIAQARTIREQAGAIETARQSATALERQLNEAKAKLPKVLDADTLNERLANKAEKLDLLLAKGCITGGQRDAMEAALKADPAAMLATCAGGNGLCAFDAAVKVLEMNPAGGADAVAPDGKEKTGRQEPSVVGKPAASAAPPPPADPKAAAEREWDENPEVRNAFNGQKANYVAVRVAELTGMLRVA